MIFYKLNQFYDQNFNVFLGLTEIKMSTLEKSLPAFNFETENPGAVGDGQKIVKKQRKMKMPKDPEAPKRPLR